VQFQAQPNAALLRNFGADHGVVVDSVQSGTPADRAGLKRGDVLQSVNGQAVHSGDELVSIVSDTDIGKKLHLDYLREGRHASVDVEVADRNGILGESGGLAGGEENPNHGSGNVGALGLVVMNLTPDQAREIASQLHLDAQQGVIVSEVHEAGFASDLGVERGDVILSVNRQPVASVDDFNRLAAGLKSGMDVVLLVARRNGPHSFTTLFLADRMP
jgi:serine protease Do